MSVPRLDPEHLARLARYRMPFGKYEGQRLLDLPDAYFVWFANQGYPPGELGRMMAEVYEIKLNGLEPLLRDL